MDLNVRFEPSGRNVRVAHGTSLLAAVNRAGLPLAAACGANALCARCGVRIVVGEESLAPEDEDERRAKSRNRIESSLRLACKLSVTGNLEVTTPYW